MRILMMLAAVAALAGCVSEAAPPPPVRITPQNFCGEAGKALGDPWLDDFQKLAIYEKMRNQGCLR